MKRINEVTFILLKTGFLIDYLRNLFNDCFFVSGRTYQSMRRLFVLTHGTMNRYLALPFQLKYRIYRGINCLSRARQLKHKGFAVILPVDNIVDLSCQIRRDLQDKPVREDRQVSSDSNQPIYDNFEIALQAPERRAPRLFHAIADVYSCVSIWSLIEELKLSNVAADYLGCQPLLTQIQSWHVVPLKINEQNHQSLYSFSAQSFHFDMDWLKFIKFFINLTNVSEQDGPFEFQPYTHDGRHRLVDQRHESDDMSRRDDLEIVTATGSPGICFAADTSGLHRDGRSKGGCRQVLQVEFAVSSFGAAYLYKSCIEKGRRWIPEDVFTNASFKGRTLALYQR